MNSNKNKKITYLELSLKINKFEVTMRRNMKSLINLNLIKHDGSFKSRPWEIIE